MSHVSTHSRPKTAVISAQTDTSRLWFQHTAARRRLRSCRLPRSWWLSFNTQPPEDGWNGHVYRQFEKVGVSTHSRPKTAGLLLERFSCGRMFQHTAARRRLVIDTMSNGGDLVSTHSRPKTAERPQRSASRTHCFNTQPPEGGWLLRQADSNASVRFNTQPPEGGWPCVLSPVSTLTAFQHTAA